MQRYAVVISLGSRVEAKLVVLVIVLLQVEQDRRCLKDNEVVPLAIDERRDAPVGVVLGVFRGLLLALGEVEEDVLVGEAELFQHERDFARGAIRENE